MSTQTKVSFFPRHESCIRLSTTFRNLRAIRNKSKIIGEIGQTNIPVKLFEKSDKAVPEKKISKIAKKIPFGCHGNQSFFFGKQIL